MTGKERLTAAITGRKVDRAPIWLREGFELFEELPAKDDFRNGWKHQPVFRSLCKYVEPYIDFIGHWGIGQIVNRFLMIPERYIHNETARIENYHRILDGYIETPSGNLDFRKVWKRGNNNGWMTKPPVQSIEDLKKVAEIPFDLDEDLVRRRRGNRCGVSETVGDRGIVRFGLSSPIVIISGLMNLELFLELSVTHREYFHALMEEITDRELRLIDALFGSRGPTGSETIVNIGGSEQCTPPLMRPESYDELVVPYDSQLIDRLHGFGIPVSIHCHGRVGHALSCMKEMNVDATDPVEPPPAGDCTFDEAQEITGGDVTLIGNLEYNEFSGSEPKRIRERVKDIFRNGNRRIILSASAGPNTFIDSAIADNYRAFVDAGLEYGS